MVTLEASSGQLGYAMLGSDGYQALDLVPGTKVRKDRNKMNKATARWLSATSKHHHEEQELSVARGHFNAAREAGGASATKIQFSAHLIHCHKHDGCVMIDVMRIGELQGEATVDFTTEDGNAKAGVHYEQAKGTLVFKEGQALASFKVTLIQFQFWASLLEFKAHLTRVTGDAELSRRLHHCRVDIVPNIDDDYFPTNRYKDHTSPVPGLLLMWEYVRFNHMHFGLRWRLWLMIGLSQTHNLYWLLLTRLQVYLVNTLMAKQENRDEDLWLASREETAMVWGALYVVPFALLHLIDWIEVKLCLKIEAEALLQNAIFRTYLTYTTESRSGLRASDINLSLLSDVPELVQSGFIAITPMLRFFGKLAVVAWFIMHRNPKLSWVLIVWPALLIAFIAFRYKTLMQIGDEKDELKKKVRNFVTEITDDFDLIGPYHMRPQMSLMFKNLIRSFQDGRIREQIEELHNHYFSPWLGTLFIGLYVVVGSAAVFEKTLSLGDFLATIHVFKDVGGECKEMYKRVYDLCMSTGALDGTIDMLNADSNCKRWVKRNEDSRQIVRDQCLAFSVDTGSKGVDETPIILQGVNFRYSIAKAHVFKNISLKVQQGKLVSIIGDMHAGKTTLVKLLGDLLLLQEGQLDIPSHLHMLLVEQKPFIMESLSCFENLSFGSQGKMDSPQELWNIVENVAHRMDEIRSVAIVKEMLESEKKAFENVQDKTAPDLDPAQAPRKCCACCRPQKSEHLKDMNSLDMLNLLEASGEDLNWVDQLSIVDRFMFSLARAFVHNPEVLVVDRPMRWFESVQRRNQMFQLFREFVDKRGLGLDPTHEMLSRPRTCILTLSVWFPKIRLCDEVWHLQKDGIRRLTPDEIEKRIAEEMAVIGNQDT